MIKHMKDLNNMYYLLNQDEPLSLSDAESDLMYILTFEEFYTERCINLNGVIFADEILPLQKEKLEEIVDLQRRILDGFKYDMEILIEVVNEGNYKEICKLANFLLERLKVNMWATEGKKKNLALEEKGYKPTNKYPEDNSLFVEIYFVEKLKEIANVDALQLKRGK